MQQLSVISHADFRLTGNHKDPKERLNTTINKKKDRFNATNILTENTPGYISEYKYWLL